MSVVLINDVGKGKAVRPGTKAHFGRKRIIFGHTGGGMNYKL